MASKSNGFMVRLAAAALFAAWSAVGAAWAAEDRVAIKGYDPVAYFTESKATVGDPNHQFEWDGTVYRFASARHLEMFKADPDRYLPQFGNLCTASLAGGLRIAGDPRYWLVRDGKLYLFGSPPGPDLMTLNPADMMAKADAHWIKMSRPSANRP
ncbi:MAG TPA: YHS domain-containing (seleno)protein [Alphaproteobacteria bacterium]